jgi:hypothetical protein
MIRPEDAVNVFSNITEVEHPFLARRGIIASRDRAMLWQGGSIRCAAMNARLIRGTVSLDRGDGSAKLAWKSLEVTRESVSLYAGVESCAG